MTIDRDDRSIGGCEGASVVRDLNIEVRTGQVVTLLVRPGVGTTTALRAIAGLTPAMTGGVRRCEPHDDRHDASAFAAEAWAQASGAKHLHEAHCSAEPEAGMGPPERALDIYPELKPHVGRQST